MREKTITTMTPLDVGDVYTVGKERYKIVKAIDKYTYEARPLRFYERLWQPVKRFLHKLGI